MDNDISYLGRQFRLWIAFQCVLIKMNFRHLRRAWRYATYTLSADDAQIVMLGCRHPAGWYPMAILTVEDTLELAREMFDDHPELPRLIADACAFVDRKWMSTGDELYEAIRWAIENAEEDAKQQGISLTRRDSGADAAGEGDQP